MKEELMDNLCSLIILRIASRTIVSNSFMFRNIFSNSLGLIIDEAYLIKQLKEKGLITHGGVINNSSFFKVVETTEKGMAYYEDEIQNIGIPNGLFSKVREEKLRTYLGIPPFTRICL